MRIPQLFRFSLYGFLKNQQYYDPFLMLILLQEKGLSFTMVGVLFGFRELATAAMEVPSGAVADLFGRRRSMLLSFGAYVVSFATFARARSVGLLFAAMALFAVGEAFRTGTHKAMILHWLRLAGREGDKTQVYGYTRSWSKVGSFASLPVAVGIVLVAGRLGWPMSSVFWFCLVPYAIAIVNFLGYPAELEGERTTERGGRHSVTASAPVRAGRAGQNAPRALVSPAWRRVRAHLLRALREAVRNARLRRVLAESMGYESVHKVVTRYYVQPAVAMLAAGLPVFLSLGEQGRTAVLIGLVHLPLYVAAVPAARKAHVVARRCGGESRAARGLWIATAAVFAGITASLAGGLVWLAVAGFVLATLLQNVWRPVTIARVDNETESAAGATMLSIESQVRSVGAMVFAPAVGYLVDVMTQHPDRPALWVAGLLSTVVLLLGAAAPTMPRARAERPE
jgi:MFS family permease